MSARALLLAAGFVAASFTPAFCESVTATVTNWDAASRTITLDDNSQFASIPNTVMVPNLKQGDEVTVDFEASESGIEAINSITVITDVAKRQVTPPKRG
ncbi:MAG: hypothetical protein K9G60_02495 [Pseudolabrys sp.]|nr:hypothetical protein [Pseudolabrys sp.]